MVSRDQVIGGIIFVVCLVLAILYTVGLFYFGNPLGRWTIEFWLVAIPVLIAFMGIGAWIGWTMATTPPPIPIEEIEYEIEKEEEATSESKAEEN